MSDAAPILSESNRTNEATDVAAQAADDGRLPVTFVILTKDEERNLPDCLQSIISLSDDIHVLDSGSADRTLEIADSFGVPVYSHAFYGFGEQRNWAIDHIPHRYDWVFHLDADERMTNALAQEIRQRLSHATDEAGFFIPNKLMFCGQWLRRASGYPTYQVRLFHRKRMRFIDQGHGQREAAQGEVGHLTQPYVHEAFSKGLDEWMTKHSRYALREAEHFLAHTGGSLIRDIYSLGSRDRITRRRAIKRISFRLPCRSFLRFLDVVFIKRAFLDGPAGLAYARMMAAYESMITAHMAALQCGAGTTIQPGGFPKSPLNDAQTLPTRRPR